jgi:hypothetical protein
VYKIVRKMRKRRNRRRRNSWSKRILRWARREKYTTFSRKSCLRSKRLIKV